MIRRSQSIAIILILLTSFSASLAYQARGQSSVPAAPFDYKPIVARAGQDYEEVLSHMQNLSSLGSRFTSYPGYEKAADYIESWFNRYLVDVSSHSFNVTVFVDGGASMEVPIVDREIELFSVVPNSVSFFSSPEGISGELVYVAKGELQDLRGKPIDGSIVMMDFDSGTNWLYAVELGAKAVVFVESEMALRGNAFAKYLKTVSLRFPRLMVGRSDAADLIALLKNNGPFDVTVRIDAGWEERDARNILGFIEGKTYPEDVVVICSYFDSYSVVPRVSPGASETGGIASLLALVKYYSENPPDYTILFVAFSGHNQGLVGSREWIKEYLLSYEGYPQAPPENSLLSRLVAVFNLNLLPDTNVVFPIITGNFYLEGDGFNVWPVKAKAEYLTFVGEWLKDQTGKDYGFYPYGEVVASDLFYAQKAEEAPAIAGAIHNPWLDHEPFAYAGGQSYVTVSFSTGRATYPFYGSPSDRYDMVQPLVGNLKPQLELVYSWLYTYLHTDFLHSLEPPRVISLWADVKAYPVVWNITEGKYTRFVKSPGQTAIIKISLKKGISLEDSTVFVIADDNGEFRLHGLTSRNTRYTTYDFDMYVLDDSGNIELAKDTGQHAIPYPLIGGSGNAQFFEPAIELENEVAITVFGCGTAVFFNTVDPNFLTPPSSPLVIEVDYADTHTPLTSSSLKSEYLPYQWHLSAVHIEPDVPVEFLITTSYQRKSPLAILGNASTDSMLGHTIALGEQAILTNTQLEIAKSFNLLNNQRVNVIGQTGISLDLDPHLKSLESLEKTAEALGLYDYDAARGMSWDSWWLSLEAYKTVRSAIEEAVFVIPFFGILAIPFSFLMGKLSVDRGGAKQLLAILLTAISVILFFTFMHPGFSLASNITIALVSFAILTLITPILIVVTNEISTALRDLRRKAIGEHFFGSSLPGISLEAFSVGVSYLKKRPLRTTLSVATIILMSLSMVLFTSMIPTTFTKPLGVVAQTITYEGILLQRPDFGIGGGTVYGVSENIPGLLRQKYGEEALIVPRLWVWPTYLPNQDFAGFLAVNPENGKGYVIRGLIGLTPEEAELTHIDVILSEGSRWFIESGGLVCIIPSGMADKLEISEVPSTINLLGLPFRVVGILDARLENIVDINQQALTPLDLTQPDSSIHIFSDFTLIVPFETAKLFLSYEAWSGSSEIASVAIAFNDPNDIPAAAAELYERFGYETWASYQDSVSRYASGVAVSQSGWHIQVVTMVLVGLTILNVMLGAAHQRIKEIPTLSTIGLSPLHVSLLFIAEAAVLGVIGSMFGYLIGIGTMKIAQILGVEGIFFNYASFTVTTAVGFSLVSVFIASIYPTYKISRMVTPSLERKWKIKTRPLGKSWSIPMPFICESEDETLGILEYIREFMEQHRSASAENFSVKDLSYIETKADDADIRKIVSRVSLAPYDVGVKQKVELTAIIDKTSSKISFRVELYRETGTRKDWERHNRSFVDSLRKQYIIWRTLRPEVRSTYEQRARANLKSIKQDSEATVSD